MPAMTLRGYGGCVFLGAIAVPQGVLRAWGRPGPVLRPAACSGRLHLRRSSSVFDAPQWSGESATVPLKLGGGVLGRSRLRRGFGVPWSQGRIDEIRKKKPDEALSMGRLVSCPERKRSELFNCFFCNTRPFSETQVKPVSSRNHAPNDRTPLASNRDTRGVRPIH